MIKVKWLIFVCVCVLGSSFAQATVTSQFYDFNNNQLPSGWGSLGPVVKNQRVEFSSVGDQYGNNNTYAPINLDGVRRLTIDYDVGSSSSTASLWTMVWGGSWNTYNNGIAGVNGNSQATVQTQTASQTSASFLDIAGSGPVHLSATFSDGLASLTATRINSGAVSKIENVAAPYLDLSGFHAFGLFGTVWNPNETGWIDNLKITTEKIDVSTPPPKAVGLFIGVQDGNSYYYDKATGIIVPPMDGDGTATELFNSFKAKGHDAELLTANRLFGGSISKLQVLNTLLAMENSGRIVKGDELVLYVNSHGSGGLGFNESLVIGQGLADGLSDNDLYEVLSAFDPGGLYKKVIYLDACHAGGFWTSDAGETGIGNLRTLNNVAVYAAATENTLSYYDITGEGFFSRALDYAIDNGLDQSMSPSDFGNFLSSETQSLVSRYGLTQTVMYSGDLGEPVGVDTALIDPMWAASSDFDLSGPTIFAAVPEPGTITLILLAFGVLGVSRRRRTLQ